MPLLVREQGTPEWHLAHVGRITASIAAACLGLCPHTSAKKAWRTAMGAEPHRENPAMQYGREHEEEARQAYEVWSGHLVEETGFWIHPVAGWLGASPDGLIGKDGLVEIKCPGRLPDSIPMPHRIQMLVQLYVTRRQWCDYFAWTLDGFFSDRITHTQEPMGLLRKLELFKLLYLDTGAEPPRKKRRKK